jgi:hypothetical protein
LSEIVISFILCSIVVSVDMDSLFIFLYECMFSLFNSHENSQVFEFLWRRGFVEEYSAI